MYARQKLGQDSHANGKTPTIPAAPSSPRKNPNSNKMHTAELHKQTRAVLALLRIPDTVRAGKTKNFPYLEVAENKQTETDELLFALLKVIH